jgi:hypothetical protein
MSSFVICRLVAANMLFVQRRTPAPAAQAANFGLLDLQLAEADRRPFKLPLLGELPIEPAQAIHSRFDDDERRARPRSTQPAASTLQEIRRICKK